MAPEFWRAGGTVARARALLGKRLVRTVGGERAAWRITEVEAYDGVRDLACHAARGRRTPRTEVMFRPGGVWYVYLCYGMHEMLNLVVGPEGYPAAVLIRGLEGVSGPGRVTRRLGIGRSLNGVAATPANGLHVEEAVEAGPRRAIRSGPRIGVAYAGPVWAAKPWRFWLEE